MTSRVYINIEADTSDEAREQMARLLGTTTFTPIEGSSREPEIIQSLETENAAASAEAFKAGFEAGAGYPNATVVPETSAPVAQGAKRQVGQPSPGKTRRTKAEIAEDDAFLAGAGKELAAVLTAVLTTATEADAQPLVEDSPETQAADAADEAAETEAARDPAKPLTLDDVRNKLGDYVSKYGMAAAQADGPVLIAKVLGVEPDPKAPRKISDLGDDQAILKRAVDGVSEMIAKNPFKREAVAA